MEARAFDQELDIHPTAIVHPKAVLEQGVVIGPYSIVGEHVRIGKGCSIGSHVRVEGHTVLGEHNVIGHGAVVGQTPQDLKYAGEPSCLIMGSGNRICEYTTISGGTAIGGGKTVIGSNNLIMSYVYIAHDVHMADHVIVANSVQVAGHVHLDSYAVIGGQTGLHQFTRVGRLAMVGGQSRVTQDVMPYSLVAGDPPKLYGPNTVGLKRAKMDSATRNLLHHAFRVIGRSGMNVTAAKAKLMEEFGQQTMIQEIVAFIENSHRGIHRRNV